MLYINVNNKDGVTYYKEKHILIFRNIVKEYFSASILMNVF